MTNITPLRAIRLYCLECSAKQPKEVRLCPCDKCPLYVYRFGKNPARNNVGGNNGQYLPKHQ